MKWKAADEHYAVSDCGYYTISKTGANHPIEEAVYTAWYRTGAKPSSDTGIMPTLLLATTDGKAAGRACERHQRQQLKQQCAA